MVKAAGSPQPPNLLTKLKNNAGKITGTLALAKAITGGSDTAKADELQALLDDLNAPPTKIFQVERNTDTLPVGQTVVAKVGPEDRVSPPPKADRSQTKQVSSRRTSSPEYIQKQKAQRRKILNDFAHLLPSGQSERNSFKERIGKLNNSSLGTLLNAANYLMKEGILSAKQKEQFFRSENLLHSAQILGKAANVKSRGKTSDEKTIRFLSSQLNKLTLLEFREAKVDKNIDIVAIR